MWFLSSDFFFLSFLIHYFNHFIHSLQMQEGIVEKINSFLPPSIHVYGVTKVTQSFVAKNRVDSRQYEYIVPSWCISAGDPYFVLSFSFIVNSFFFLFFP